MSAPEDGRQLVQQIDSRICPPDQVLDWESSLISTAELAVINHTHGIIGGHVKGPDFAKIAVGLRTLRETEGLKQASFRATENVSASFADAVSGNREELAEGLNSRVNNLRFADREDEIIPAILSQYSHDFAYPNGVIEDLSSLATSRAVDTHARREGLFSSVDWELFLTLDGLLAAKVFDKTSPLGSIEISDREKAALGRLTGLHRDVNDRTFIELSLDRDDTRERIPYDKVTKVGVMFVTEAVPIAEAKTTS